MTAINDILAIVISSESIADAIMKLAEIWGELSLPSLNTFLRYHLTRCDLSALAINFAPSRAFMHRVRDQRYTTDIGSNYILRSDATLPRQPQQRVAVRGDRRADATLCRGRKWRTSILSLRFNRALPSYSEAGKAKGASFGTIVCFSLGKNRNIKVESSFTQITNVLFVHFVNSIHKIVNSA